MLPLYLYSETIYSYLKTKQNVFLFENILKYNFTC